MATRILPAISDPDTARSVGTLLGQLPGSQALPPVGDSTALLDTLARHAEESVAELPEVVLVHEAIGPMPALDLIRDLALRFPAVGVVLLTTDASAGLYSAAMDAGARGVMPLPLSLGELGARVHAAAQWAAGVRHHLGVSPDTAAGHGGTVVTVCGGKGGVGTTLTAVQLALAARAAGRETILVDLDLLSGDVASCLDVQFRRSVADLAGIPDLTPRVLAEAVYTHPTGLALLLAPGEGERGEEVTEEAVRQLLGALRARYQVVVLDCGNQLTSAGAAAIETADTAVLVTTPDVVAVRGARRTVRMWERLQVRKAEDVITVVNRLTRGTEIQPPLIAQIVRTRLARTSVPSQYRELQSCMDAGRLQDLDGRSTVRQALWALAAELGLADEHAPAAGGPAALPSGGRGGRSGKGKGKGMLLRRRGLGDDRGAVTVEFAGMLPYIALVLVVVWQCVLIGYTFSLAGNAADEGARAATAARASGDQQGACAEAARAHLPAAWRERASVSCQQAAGLWKAQVDLRPPVLFPGSVHLPFAVSGEAGAAQEGPDAA